MHSLTDGQSCRVLVLDDDAAVGEVICSAVNHFNVEARATCLLADFLRELDEWQPSHIVLDLLMPKVDGIEVLRLLGERHCRAAIILSSGVSDRVLDAARRSAIAHGLNLTAAISKPFTLAQMRVALAASLQGAPASASSPDPGADRPPRFIPTETELMLAIINREFDLVYQPQIVCQSRKTVGFEALARWHHPQRGIVPPDSFIPFAEKTGHIDSLTDLLFEKALNWYAATLAERRMTLSLNLSAKSLKDVGFADRLEKRCGNLSVDPSAIVLEVTETSAMSDRLNALDLLTRLRMKGFHLSVDDFGMGYSSLLQVADLPFSSLKIDKKFVIEAEESASSRRLVRSIVALGQSLGLRITAEGVETLPSLEFLESVGCDSAQGYYIARPMPGDLVLEWLGSTGLRFAGAGAATVT